MKLVKIIYKSINGRSSYNGLLDDNGEQVYFSIINKRVIFYDAQGNIEKRDDLLSKLMKGKGAAQWMQARA